MKNINETALIEAKKWDMKNTAMEPVEVPYNCKAIYNYQQPVVYDKLENLSKDYILDAFNGWGIVTIQSDYVMTLQEKGERQENLRKAGAIIVGNMRLTSQTFSRDKDAISIDELGDMFGDE